jgi:hypothetical protein
MTGPGSAGQVGVVDNGYGGAAVIAVPAGLRMAIVGFAGTQSSWSQFSCATDDRQQTTGPELDTLRTVTVSRCPMGTLCMCFRLTTPSLTGQPRLSTSTSTAASACDRWLPASSAGSSSAAARCPRPTRVPYLVEAVLPVRRAPGSAVGTVRARDHRPRRRETCAPSVDSRLDVTSPPSGPLSGKGRTDVLAGTVAPSRRREP